MKAIGIDIGSYSVKIAELSQTKKGVLVHSVEEHLLGQNPAFDPEIEIVEILRALTIKHEPGTVQFILGLRQEFVTQRLKVFPFQDRLKIAQSLPFELEEDTPFSSENAVFDAKLVRLAGKITEVLAFVAPKNKIKEALARFESSNLTVHILSSESMGIANLVENWNEAIIPIPGEVIDPEDETRPRRPLRMLIQLGNKHTQVIAFAGDRMAACRTVLTGTNQVAEAIAKRYEIPIIEALKELETKGFILPSKEGASYDQIVFSDTIAKALKEVSRGIRMALLELQSELHGDFVEAQVTGGGAQLQNLSAYLTTQLELPVNVYRWKHLFYFENEISPRLEMVSGTAVGLAIEAFKKPRNPAINFRRGEFALENEGARIFWETWGGTIKAASLVFVIGFTYSLLRDSFAYSLAERAYDHLVDQARSVAKLPAKQANDSGVRKYIRSEKTRIKEAETLIGIVRMNSAMEVLKTINDAIPGRDQLNIQVRKLFIEDDQVTFEGLVKDSQGVGLLEQSIKRVASGGRVQATQGNQTPEGTSFSMRFRMERGIEKAGGR